MGKKGVIYPDSEFDLEKIIKKLRGGNLDIKPNNYNQILGLYNQPKLYDPYFDSPYSFLAENFYIKSKPQYGKIDPSKYIEKIKEKPVVYTPPAEYSFDPVKFEEEIKSLQNAEQNAIKQKAEQNALNKKKKSEMESAEIKAAEKAIPISDKKAIEQEADEEETESAEEERERRDIESISSKDGPWRMPLGNVGYLEVDLSESPPVLHDFHSQFSAFETLVRENYTALECMMSMRAALSAGEGSLLESCIGAINAVRKMVWCHAAISDVHGDKNFYSSLQPYVAKIGKAALDAVKQADAALRCGYPEIAARHSATLFEKVEKLSEKLQGANAAQQSIATCQSLHDLVRIFHQAGSTGLFQHMQSPYTLNFHNASFVIGDIGGATTGYDTDHNKVVSKPVLALREFYQQPRCKKKKGGEKYSIIANADRARVQCALGCHNAEIDAQVKGNESFVYFRFFDTDAKQYPNAPYRTAYVRKVLARLGFDVGGNSKLTEALMSNKPESETYKGLTELAALIASTKDLDVDGSPLKSKAMVRKAVNAFFKGCVNIYDELS